MSLRGGIPVGSDGRTHPTFVHNPSTLRLSCQEPNLQQVPRGSGNVWEEWVKDMFLAAPGKVFWERDYSAIEAVLTFYFAGSMKGVHLAKLGVHDFLTSHIIKRPADLSWSDNDLKDYFQVVKKENGLIREAAKRVIHGSHYMMTPNRMSELYPDYFPNTKAAASLQSIYFDLFPEIRIWHKDTCNRVDGTKRREAEAQEVLDPWTLGVCYLKNPFGYCHRFYDVLSWDKINGEWFSSYGPDAKRAVAYLPQSTAAAIIKNSAKELWYNYGYIGETIRLLIHDSILGETEEEQLNECLRVSKEVMERPIVELPLDPSWNMGEYLSIGTEAKSHRCWGEM